MTQVHVQIDVAEFCAPTHDGSILDHGKDMTSVFAAFVTLAMATRTTLAGTPVETAPTVFGTFEVPDEQVDAFCAVVDWTGFAAASLD